MRARTKLLLLSLGLWVSAFVIVQLSWRRPRSSSAGSRGVATDRAAQESNASVLVLGSGGLIGQPLVALLKRQGYRVHEVPSRNVLDLRIPGALQQRFANTSFEFAFFLAAEVGAGGRATRCTGRVLGMKLVCQQQHSAWGPGSREPSPCA